MARLAFLLPNLGGGGAERVTLTLVRAFLDRGHEVDLLVMERNGELLDLVPAAAGLVDLQAPRTRQVVGPLIRYLRQRRPDALHAAMWPLTTAAILANMIARVRTRCIVSDHAIMSDHHPRSVHRRIAVTTRLLYPRAAARIAVSQGAADDFAKLSGLPRAVFDVIPNPIDFPGKLRTDPETEALWQGHSPRILTAGQLKPEKNQALLIRAFARLARESDNAGLLIAGEGALRDELRSLAQGEGVGDRVFFAGYFADLWPLYASADLFALSSREESFGNVLIEALYVGLPIVSSDTTGSREILERGRWGMLIAQNDVAVFATGMRDALKSPIDADAWRERALAMSGEASVERYERLLVGRD